MAAIKEAHGLLDRLRAAYSKGDFAGAKSVYDQLKVRAREVSSRGLLLSSFGASFSRARAAHPLKPNYPLTTQQVKLIHLPALPPTFESTPTAQQELLIGRESFVFVSASASGARRPTPLLLSSRSLAHSPQPPLLLPPSQTHTHASTQTTGESLELAAMAALRALPASGAAAAGADADALLAASPAERALERLLAQVRAFYADVAPLALPPSPHEPALTGAVLLRLLVLGRRAEFHCALERLPPALASDPAVAPSVQLERWLTEGAYNKALEAAASARASVPPPLASAYLARLAATVRDEVASCAEAAYASLPLADAARLMGIASGAEAAAYAAQRGWVVDGRGVVQFAAGAGATGGDAAAMEADAGAAAATGEDGAAAAVAPAAGCRADSLAFIGNALQYAKELERIV